MKVLLCVIMSITMFVGLALASPPQGERLRTVPVHTDPPPIDLTEFAGPEVGVVTVLDEVVVVGGVTRNHARKRTKWVCGEWETMVNGSHVKRCEWTKVK